MGYGRSVAAMLVWLAVYGDCDKLAEAQRQLRVARPNMILPAATEQKVLEAIYLLQKTR